MFYSVFSSIFGDGYTEIPKHAVGFTIGLAFQVSGLINFLAQYGFRTVENDSL